MADFRAIQPLDNASDGTLTGPEESFERGDPTTAARFGKAPRHTLEQPIPAPPKSGLDSKREMLHSNGQSPSLRRDVKDAWEYLRKLPELLNEWGSYSYALLVALLIIGIAILIAYVRFVSKDAKTPALFFLGFFLALFAGAGFLLKWTGSVMQRRAQAAWIAAHQSRPGERRLIVSNFYRLSAGEATKQEAAAHKFVSMVATIVDEDLPGSIPAPQIVSIDFDEQPSPWKSGVGQENFGEVLEQLQVLQIMWGDLDTASGVARTFLGLPPWVSTFVDAVVPLKELPLSGDPREQLQFGNSYHRLLGHVALGVALQTMRDAEQASGDDRKHLFLLASQQVRDAQARLVNGREDPVLKRNLYERGDRLIARGLAEAGVLP